uniref:scabin-related ADP-ribosyltransferase n=1 Tax=Streptomyces sp. NRRL F-2664 TaxID=1463842 RepID=UPI002D21DDD6
TTETTNPDGTRTTVLFHYTPDGAIANDTHTTPDGSGPSRTGSYLTGAAGREARTLTGTADATRYLHADRRGNTVLETGPSAQALTSRAYTDYGRETRPDGTPAPAAHRAADPAANPFRFGGEYTNTENGTDYTPARLYHPETGRFTTRDPHPTPLNKYQAFNANPAEYTDPTGNLSFKIRLRGQGKLNERNRLQNEKLQQQRKQARELNGRKSTLLPPATPVSIGKKLHAAGRIRLDPADFTSYQTSQHPDDAADLGQQNPGWHLTTSLKPRYRADRRSPEEIFKNGFQPWNPKGQGRLEKHILTTDTNGPYVSTTKSFEHAKSRGPRYIYEIEGAIGGVNPAKTYSVPRMFEREKEITYVGGIQNWAIKRVYDARNNSWINNPNYRAGAAVEGLLKNPAIAEILT